MAYTENKVLALMGIAGLTGAAIQSKVSQRRQEKQRLADKLETQEEELRQLRRELKRLTPAENRDD